MGAFSEEKIEKLIADLNLPKKFVAVTGSSFLSRNKSSVRLMDRLLNEIESFYTDIPIYFLANTKTDMYLAKKLKEKYGYSIFQVPEKHDRAMAVIAKSYIVIGGRQHPNIFAAMQGVPFIPLQGNTHKMEGVVELLHYPIDVLEWNAPSQNIQNTFEKMEEIRDKLNDIVKVPKLETICLGGK